jgi:hypothetical protein
MRLTLILAVAVAAAATVVALPAEATPDKGDYACTEQPTPQGGAEACLVQEDYEDDECEDEGRNAIRSQADSAPPYAPDTDAYVAGEAGASGERDCWVGENGRHGRYGQVEAHASACATADGPLNNPDRYTTACPASAEVHWTEDGFLPFFIDCTMGGSAGATVAFVSGDVDAEHPCVASPPNPGWGELFPPQPALP